MNYEFLFYQFLYSNEELQLHVLYNSCRCTDIHVDILSAVCIFKTVYCSINNYSTEGSIAFFFSFNPAVVGNAMKMLCC